MHPKNKSDLSPARLKLAKCMQCLNFGRIERLTIRNGEPVWDPPPRVIRYVKFGTDNGPRSESDLADYAVKARVRHLFAQFDDLDNGTILILEVMSGLPVGMQMEEATA